MIELKRTAFKFNIYGEEVELRAPIVSEYKKYEDKVNKKGSNEFSLMCEFLTDLGMKKKMIENMEAAHLIQVIKEVSTGGLKKK